MFLSAEIFSSIPDPEKINNNGKNYSTSFDPIKILKGIFLSFAHKKKGTNIKIAFNIVVDEIIYI